MLELSLYLSRSRSCFPLTNSSLVISLFVYFATNEIYSRQANGDLGGARPFVRLLMVAPSDGVRNGQLVAVAAAATTAIRHNFFDRIGWLAESWPEIKTVACCKLLRRRSSCNNYRRP